MRNWAAEIQGPPKVSRGGNPSLEESNPIAPAPVMRPRRGGPAPRPGRMLRTGAGGPLGDLFGQSRQQRGQEWQRQPLFRRRRLHGARRFSEGAFATQALSYTLSSGGPAAAADQVVLKVAIAAAVANGRFVLPKTKVPHSIEVRGRRAPDTATMGGGAMKCSTISAKEQSLARPEGTVVCSGAAARGLGEPVEAVLQWK